MARPTDQEVTDISYSHIPTGKAHQPMAICWGPQGEAPGLVRGKRDSGTLWARAFLLVSMGKNR